MPEIAGEIYDRHEEALREKVELFFKNILLLLGEDHSPSSKKAKIVRWEPRKEEIYNHYNPPYNAGK